MLFKTNVGSLPDVKLKSFSSLFNSTFNWIFDSVVEDLLSVNLNPIYDLYFKNLQKSGIISVLELLQAYCLPRDYTTNCISRLVMEHRDHNNIIQDNFSNKEILYKENLEFILLETMPTHPMKAFRNCCVNKQEPYFIAYYLKKVAIKYDLPVPCETDHVS